MTGKTEHSLKKKRQSRFPGTAALHLLSTIYQTVLRTRMRSIPARSNAGTIVLPVNVYGEISGPVRTLLNVRVSWDFKFEKYGKLRPTLEMLNITNSSSVWAYTTSNSSANFYNVSTITAPRIARFGLVYEF